MARYRIVVEFDVKEGLTLSELEELKDIVAYTVYDIIYYRFEKNVELINVEAR